MNNKDVPRGSGIRWPGGKRIAVMLTFDFDAELLQKTHIGLKDQKAGFTDLERGRYAACEGLDRCLRVLDENAVKATFFVPGYVAETYATQTREIFNRGHELAYHGYMHEAVRGIPAEEEERIMERGEAALEKITGKRPVGHRAPYGLLHPDAPALMRRRGYLYSSSMKDCDWAYLHEDGGRPVVELPTDSIVDDFTYFFFSLCYPAHRVAYTNEEFFETLRDEFDGLADEGDKILCVKLHPQLIGRAGRARALGEFIGYVQARGAWVATCEEVAGYVLENSKKEAGTV